MAEAFVFFYDQGYLNSSYDTEQPHNEDLSTFSVGLKAAPSTHSI